MELNGKKIDIDSLMVDGFSICEGRYEDGTLLTENEIDELNEKYPIIFIHERTLH
jgi:hypothetical protein